MARYFYNHSIGAQITRDEVGVVCKDDRSAINHAWAALPTIVADVSPILPFQHLEVIVRREDGAHVGRLGMTVTVEAQDPGVATALAMQKSFDGQGLNG